MDAVQTGFDIAEKPAPEDFKKVGDFVQEPTGPRRLDCVKLVKPKNSKMTQEIGGMAPEFWGSRQRGKTELTAADRK